MHKLKRKVTKFFEGVTVPHLSFPKDDGNLQPKSKNRVTPAQLAEQAKKPNSRYNDIEIFDGHEGVECVRVIDESRIAGGLDSGKVIIWDISVGRQLALLHNHQAAIKLLEVIQDASGCPRLISVCMDGLITMWDLGTSEMLKCFILSEDPNVRLIRHIAHTESPEVVTLLFGHSKLQLCHIHIHQLRDPICPQVIGRTNAGDDIIELLESSGHIVCVSDKTVDVFEKEWDTKGRLRLNHVDIPLVSDNIVYSCATLVSDDKFVVGTTYGGVFICKLDQKMKPDFYSPFSDSPVKCLTILNKEWWLVVYEKCIHIVYEETGLSEYTQQFNSSLISVTHIPQSRLLVTLATQSCKLITWDISGLSHDTNSWTQNEPQSLGCKGGLLAHDGTVKGMEVAQSNLVTFGKDSLVIIWKNKNEEILRLFKSVQDGDSDL